jgi:4-hydroxybenzoate polyprenyltransferase
MMHRTYTQVVGGGASSGLRISAWRRAVRALRAPDWWYFAVLPLTGLVGDAPGDETAAVRVPCGVLVAAFCLAYAYGLNGITDRGMDRDETKNALAGLAGVPREAVVLVAACALVAVSIAAALAPVALLGAGVSLVAGTFYSANVRLKRFPVVGTLVNVLIFAPLPLLAATHRPSLRMQLLTYCFWVLITQNQILHEIADSREDAGGGVRTTGVVAGAAGLRVIAVMLGPLAILPLWWLPTSPVALCVAALGLCAGAILVAAGDSQRAGQLRVTHRWISLGVGVVLFVLLVGPPA